MSHMSDIVNDVIAAFEALPEGYRAPSPVPEILQELIQIAFYSSVVREEQRQVRVRLIVRNSDTVLKDETFQRPHIQARFAKPQRITIDWLRKIGPAFDERTCAIAVSESLPLTAWGVISMARSESSFSQPFGAASPPEGLALTVTGPGSFLVSSGSLVIGRFSLGQFIPAYLAPLYESMHQQRIMQTLHRHGYENAQDSLKNTLLYFHYARLLTRLIQETAQRSHGATIVWLPAEAVEQYRELFRGGYRISGFADVHELLSRWKAMTTNAVTNEIEKRLTGKTLWDKHQIMLGTLNEVYYPLNTALHQMALLAQLACIDGALIVKDSLQPEVFGAKLQAPRWKGRVVEGPIADRPTPSQEVNLSIYGTRHNSAANFAGSCENAIVYVLSQDGPIRTLLKANDDTLFCWPDFVPSMEVQDMVNI